ncbi:MAG: LON peptidase substrate-binding domain-containing protein [Paraburkholderia sp.]|uniref:LON peptidase substrate-binding domain-containing protein n=1 Tax=Paraburkholderia sp. TaxID=1926495 RepID=UPI003C61FDF7
MSSTSAVLADVPLFPLHTVLFPDGLLPLKIFEARYLDMARDCLREKTHFGVCMLKSGGEVAQPDEPSVPESIGCLAEIEECDVETFGMLLIRARGTRRFRLLSHRVEPSGLLVGMAEPLPDDIPLEGNEQLAKFGACAEVLERIIATIRERDPNSLPFAEPFRLDDPSWVSNRLSEVLPIALRARQKLMELLDAGARIDVVHHYMQQHQLL